MNVFALKNWPFDLSKFAPFDFGHLAPRNTSQLSISLVCCSFFVSDVTCNPRGITVHMIF